MKRRSRLGSLAEFIEVPPEALLNVSRVEVVGRLQIRVENHRGLIQFDSAQIILSLPEGRMVIDGQALSMGWIDGKDLLVNGQISALRFEEAGNAE